jgi:uncharacterized SAM-binding protein YcdF (DUF218 family)
MVYTPYETDSHQPIAPTKAFLRRFRWLWAIASSAAALLVVLWLLLVFTPLGGWLGGFLVHVDPLEEADFIVVLGGDPERDVEAANLYRRGYAPKVIITSFDGGADADFDVAARYGLPAGAVLLDRLATHTVDHPRTIMRLGVDPRVSRVLVVTSLCHTGRARACFLRAGYRQVRMAAPSWQGFVPQGKYIDRARDLPVVTYELLARIYYRIRGWA